MFHRDFCFVIIMIEYGVIDHPLISLETYIIKKILGKYSNLYNYVLPESMPLLPYEDL